MARTRHTDPTPVRATRRVRAPRDGRGAGDPSGERASVRALKELGVVAADGPAIATDAAAFPRIQRTRPRTGHVHPLGVAEIRRVLRFFGPTCWYGLSSIELRQSPGNDGGMVRVGDYRAPDTIFLYEQATPPWFIPHGLDEDSRVILERAGALVAASTLGAEIAWPSGTLANFMLFDGLFHEIGHHVQQRYEGKRSVRTRRTKDHERRADAFAVTCRQAWMHEQAS